MNDVTDSLLKNNKSATGENTDLRSPYVVSPGNLLGKYLLILLPVVFLVMTMAIGAMAWLTWQTESAKLDSDIRAASKAFAGALSVPVWTYEISAQRSIQDSVLLNKNIVSVEVITERDVLSKYSNDYAAGDASITLTETIFAPYDADLEIGTLNIAYSHRHIRDQIIGQIGVSSMLLLILVAAVVGTSVVAQRQTIGKPLQTFLNTIRNTQPGKTPDQVAWRSHDELGEVIGAFNQLVEDLEQERLALVENEARLVKQNTSLNTIASASPSDPEHPDDVFLLIADTLIKILKCDRTAIWLKDDHTGLLSPIIERHSRDGEVISPLQNRLPPLGDCKDALTMLESGESIIAQNLDSVAELAPLRGYYDIEGIVSILYVPIIAEGGLAGLITIEQERGKRHWVADERNYSDAMAGAIANLVTAQKRHIAERRAAEKSDILETAIQSLPGGFCLVDSDFDISVFNTHFIELLDLPASATREGTSFADVMKILIKRGDIEEENNPLTGDNIREEMAVLLNDPNGHVQEIVIGESRYVEAKGSLRPDGSLVLIFNDITSRKQAEQDLIMARDKAEEATRAKSAFLASMSHELRTPMNGVIGMLDVLRRSELTKDQMASIGTIRESANSLLRILNDILDFSKIEAEKLEIEQDPFSIRQQVSSVCATLSPAVKQSGIELLANVQTGLPDQVIGDGLRLRQILLNLLGNAVKFTKKGFVRLSVFGEVDDQDICEITIEVEDSGIGVEPDQLRHLFEPFTQAESSTTRRFGGTGLGLAISHNIAALMGGSIRATSTPGVGSLFTVTLHAPLAARQEHFGLTPSDRRILAVTRNILRANTFKWVAELAGYQCTVYRDVEALIESDKTDPKELAGTIIDLAIASPAALKDYEDTVSTPVLYWQSETNQDVPVTSREKSLPIHMAGTDLMQELTVALQPNTQPPVKGQPSDVLATSTTNEPALPAVDPVHPGEKIRILLVEDHTTNQLVIRRQLMLLGYDVKVAGNGIEALQAMSLDVFDLVLTDCHMPRMDGFAFTHALRDLEQQMQIGPIPIVAITANALRGEAEKCMEAGMDGFLAKPVEMDDMALELHQWLDTRKDVTRQKLKGISKFTVAKKTLDREANLVRLDAAGNQTEAKGDPSIQDQKQTGIGNRVNPLNMLSPPPRSKKKHAKTIDSRSVNDAESPQDNLDAFPLVNITSLKTLFGNDTSGIMSMIDDFTRSNQVTLDDLGKAINDQNREQIRALSHRLKGSAGVAGAIKMRELAYIVEQESETVALDILQNKVTRLTDLFSQTQQKMRADAMA